MLKQLVPYIVSVLVFALLAWRMSRNARGRALNPSRLWIRPAILAALLALSFLHPPQITVIALGELAAAAAAGGLFGYVLASHQALTLDPATGRITSRMSPIGVVLFLCLFAARFVFRMLVTGGDAPEKVMAHSDQIQFYTDVGLIFVLALVGAQAWELWRRTRPMLAEHAARQPEPGEAG